MSLMKLFNFKYLMQNIKKSKMAIILFLSIVPIFTALTIISTASYNAVLEFYELGLANILFMYVTPFILSFCMFGYVYKKKNIDFMCSMPISRKSIFVTNTIGGIILILLAQLITFLISGLLGLFTDSIIFTGMIWDIFLYQSLAYIFVFTVANLAMTVSGNVITQIIVTILILFLVPFSVFYYDLWQGNDYDLEDNGYIVNTGYTIRDVRAYTAPSNVFGAVSSYWEYKPTTISSVKMIVLSALYIAIGYAMFEKKKMECAGESFEKPNTHFFVKALTLIPFSMMVYLAVDSEEWEALLFIVGIAAVYYLIYDLITNKKNKFITSVGMFTVSILVMSAIYGAIGKVAEDTNPEIELEDIKSITIDSVGTYLYGLDYKIEDRELIERILYEGSNDIYYDYNSISIKPVDSIMPYREPTTRIQLEMNMKNGRRFNTRLYLSADILESVLDNTTYSISDIGEIEYGYDDTRFLKEEKQKLKTLLSQAVNEDGLNNIYDKVKKTKEPLINTYKYTNHELREIRFPLELNNEVFTIITSAENRNAAELVRKRKNLDIHISVNYGTKNEFYYYGSCPMTLKEYVIQNEATLCDVNKDYINIYLEGTNFYSNDIENIIRLIKASSEYKKFKGEKDYEYYWDEPVFNTVTDEVTTTTTIDFADPVEIPKSL